MPTLTAEETAALNRGDLNTLGQVATRIRLGSILQALSAGVLPDMAISAGEIEDGAITPAKLHQDAIDLFDPAGAAGAAQAAAAADATVKAAAAQAASDPAGSAAAAQAASDPAGSAAAAQAAAIAASLPLHGTADRAARLNSAGFFVGSVSGRNSWGPCTLTGAKVGDVVLALQVRSHPSNGNRGSFESAITVENQIQQTDGANLSLEVFDVLLLRA